jgi:hypothetical protein
MNVGGLGDADFNKAIAARKSSNSIRCVAITTRRRYGVAITSRLQLAHALFTNRGEFMLATSRLQARSIVVMPTKSNRVFKVKRVWKISCSHETAQRQSLRGTHSDYKRDVGQ